MNRFARGLLITATTLIAACASPSKTDSNELPESLDAAIKSSYRTEENTKRDQYRNPKETLEFFGIEPNMTVVEISPGAGWYMEILAPYLSREGQYIGALPPSEGSEYMTRLNKQVQGWLDSHPEVKEKVRTSVFDPAKGAEIAPENSADMVLTFRNIHNWVGRGTAEDAFKSFFEALKPGGVLGVVEHRANADSKKDPKASSGYMREADVIALALSAGFKLDGKSEVNANPKDTKDHPKGVWTLPPTLRLGEENRDQYLKIGESDRMTLRFVKPE